MKSGRLPKAGQHASDDIIAGSDRDPAKLADLADHDPEPKVAQEDEPAMAGT
jgi:hypothetical protein